jgi:hypothetical protein
VRALDLAERCRERESAIGLASDMPAVSLIDSQATFATGVSIFISVMKHLLLRCYGHRSHCGVRRQGLDANSPGS